MQFFLISEKKKKYTTTTERKSFGELLWPQRKAFQAVVDTKTLPKGPFRIKNAMALETGVFSAAVVFYYPYQLVAIFPEKYSIFRPFAVVNRYDHSDLLLL